MEKESAEQALKDIRTVFICTEKLLKEAIDMLNRLSKAVEEEANKRSDADHRRRHSLYP